MTVENNAGVEKTPLLFNPSRRAIISAVTHGINLFFDYRNHGHRTTFSKPPTT